MQSPGQVVVLPVRIGCAGSPVERASGLGAGRSSVSRPRLNGSSFSHHDRAKATRAIGTARKKTAWREDEKAWTTPSWAAAGSAWIRAGLERRDAALSPF